MAGVVDGLQRHATGEGAIANHRHRFEALSQLVPGQGHAQGRRNTGGGVAGAEVVEHALAALQVARHAALLAQAVKTVVSARHQLVGIGLVTHVPHNPIVVEVEGLVEGQGQFNHSQARA